MPIFSVRNLCPNCGIPIQKDDANCARCGCELQPTIPPLPDGMTRHRGKKIILLAVTSALLFFLGGCAFGLTGYFGRGGIQAVLPYLLVGITALGVGQVCGLAGVVFAYRDWVGMRVGRVDRSGLGQTVFGGFLAGISVLLYWVMLGTYVARQF